MAGAVVSCSIVIADVGWGDVNRADLATHRDAPAARGLISISEESWPQASGSPSLRAVISIQATNAASVRWYARDVLGLDERHPAWIDMERQLRSGVIRPAAGDDARATSAPPGG